ncbi:unnamed protein product [Gordionus sp. m RMFG-2023]
MLFDTGVSISLMSQENFYKYWPGGKLEKEALCVRQFDGSEVAVVGKAKLGVNLNDVIFFLDLWVVKESVETIMGWSWIVQLGLFNNFWNIFAKPGATNETKNMSLVVNKVRDKIREIEGTDSTVKEGNSTCNSEIYIGSTELIVEGNSKTPGVLGVKAII